MYLFDLMFTFSLSRSLSMFIWRLSVFLRRVLSFPNSIFMNSLVIFILHINFS